MAVKQGLRERKKTATRQAISDAALALALERGSAAVTVDDIAAAADVSPRTVFNYFPTKEQAILGFDPGRTVEMAERLAARPEDETPVVSMREALRGGGWEGAVVWRQRAELARENPQLFSAYIAGFAELEGALTGALARRLGLDPATNLYPRLVVTAALTAIRVATVHAIEQGTPESLAEAVDEAFGLLSSGFQLPKGAR